MQRGASPALRQDLRPRCEQALAPTSPESSHKWKLLLFLQAIAGHWSMPDCTGVSKFAWISDYELTLVSGTIVQGSSHHMGIQMLSLLIVGSSCIWALVLSHHPCWQMDMSFH